MNANPPPSPPSRVRDGSYDGGSKKAKGKSSDDTYGGSSKKGGKKYSSPNEDPHGRSHDDPRYTGPQPVLLDLDGDGVSITEAQNSSIYMDATGDGLKNRTAWAGAGDGVLFYDPDGKNAIVEKRQYVFTEWDPTAGSDMEALALVFDSNGDGVLAKLALCRVGQYESLMS
ncbi:hypothetical protein [Halovulum sp. GXIMD14793]